MKETENTPVVLSEDEINQMRDGGRIWQEIKVELLKNIRVGTTGEHLNNLAKDLFDKKGVKPAFFEYENFPGHICVSVNDCIVHGVGNDTVLKAGDKVTLDVGFKNHNVYIDSAFTVVIDPDSNPKYKEFVDICYQSLWVAIKEIKKIVESGKVLFNGDIAHAIESYINSHQKHWPKMRLIDGYVGHTIGKKIHLKPHIFNKGLLPGSGDEIKRNTVICIEPMTLNQGSGLFGKRLDNPFDVFAKEENAYTCHWEHMVLVKNDSIEVLTATEEELRDNNFFG